MDRKIILDEIGRLLETLNEQTETLRQFAGPVPQIEIDILLSNIRELYEKYRELDRFNRPGISSEKVEKNVIAIKDKPVVPKLTEQPVSEKEILEFEKNMLVESINQYTMLSGNAVEENTEIQQEPEFSQKKIKSQKKSSPDLFSTTENTIIGKFKDDKKSLNEMLSDNANDKSIASKLQKNPVKDLKTAIGINEKFMFINELFEGSLQKYNESINSLNSQKSKADAMKLMDVMMGEFSWKKDSDAYNALSDLVSRRYQ